MKTQTRLIKSKTDAQSLIAWLTNNNEYPFSVSLKPGTEKRSNQQNRLAFQWCKDAEDQGDNTAPEYRAYCKLHFGVPILRADNEEFREQYDKAIRPLTYEQKLLIMLEPIDFPVTRLMGVKQQTLYLNKIYQHFTGLGIQLTEPSLMGMTDWREAR